jgi:hypothetical protein
LLVALLFSSGCKKFVEIKNPRNQLVTEETFSNDQTATSAVAGLYNRMMNTNLYFMNGALSLYLGLTSDEIYNTSSSTDVDQFTNNSLLANNGIIKSNFWGEAYSRIYHANAIIEGLNSSRTVTDSVRRQLTGEALFVRALFYFYMVNLFGDLPLVLSTDYDGNSKLPRTPAAEIYRQIISDLTSARDLLPSYYVTTPSFSKDRVRANKWAAKALLARVYLYKNDWPNAEAQTTDVINSGLFSLQSLDNVFSVSTPQESILQLLPASSSSRNSAEGGVFIPSSNSIIPPFVLTPSLLNSFEPNDGRKAVWTDSSKVGNPQRLYYYPKKYKVRSATAKTEYEMVLRLAEQYLIRAEARAQQNNIQGSHSDINKVRNRAGLPDTDADDPARLMKAIENERRWEFFTEFGHRWLDLKRWGKLDSVLTILKGSNWQTTDALFPLPISEIQLHPLLTQNPGY